MSDGAEEAEGAWLRGVMVRDGIECATQEDPMWGRYNPCVAQLAREEEERLAELQRLIFSVSWEKAQRRHAGHAQDIREIERARSALRQLSYNNNPRVREDPWRPLPKRRGR